MIKAFRQNRRSRLFHGFQTEQKRIKSPCIRLYPDARAVFAVDSHSGFRFEIMMFCVDIQPHSGMFYSFSCFNHCSDFCSGLSPEFFFSSGLDAVSSESKKKASKNCFFKACTF